jgi:hypothetical protein
VRQFGHPFLFQFLPDSTECHDSLDIKGNLIFCAQYKMKFNGNLSTFMSKEHKRADRVLIV